MQAAELAIQKVSADPVSAERRLSAYRCGITRSRTPPTLWETIVRLQMRHHAARLHGPYVGTGGGDVNQL